MLHEDTVQRLRQALTAPQAVTVRRDPAEATATVTVGGTASGILVGGLLTALSTEAGAGLPPLDGAILFLEHPLGHLRHVDRALTQLARSGALKGLRGVALGQFTGFEHDTTQDGGWDVTHVLRDHFGHLAIPVLGGLPIGHGDHPPTLPLGSEATIDATAGTLTVQPALT